MPNRRTEMAVDVPALHQTKSLPLSKLNMLHSGMLSLKRRSLERVLQDDLSETCGQFKIHPNCITKYCEVLGLGPKKKLPYSRVIFH